MLNMTIAGNVGRDAVLRRTNSGDAVLGFSLAVDMGKDKNGSKRESVWINCSIWGKRAESLERYITKGSKLVLSGRPSVNVYEGKGSLNLSVQELTFMGGAQDRQDDGYGSSDDGYGQQQNDNQSGGQSGLDDEIPF
jgi:single-strand DNA-binding protein